MAELAILLVDIFVDSDSLWQDSLKLACNLKHPAYDYFYLVLAKNQKATLLTADKRLIKVAQEVNINIVSPH